MSEQKAYWPKDREDLMEYIDSLVEGPHDYNTSAYAMSLAAIAAFNYIGSTLGCSGFQASCADLEFLKMSRHLEGPFALLDGSKLLYPQYDLEEQVREYLEEWRPALADKAQELIDEYDAKPEEVQAHPNVRARWEEIAALKEEG